MGPCLQDIVSDALRDTGELAKGLSPASQRRAVDEIAVLLKALVLKVYKRMVYVGQALRGKGKPSSAPPYDA